MAQGKVEICGVNTGKASNPERRGKGSFVCAHKSRGCRGEGRIYQRKSTPCAQRDKAVWRKQ